MIDINELRQLMQAVVKGWGNCDRAWLDQSEDTPAAVVGHIDEDGETYPVATIDCDQYFAAHQSLPLAKFYAAANPAAISELLDRLEAAEKETASWKAAVKKQADAEFCLRVKKEEEYTRLRAKIEQMEQQEPVATVIKEGDRRYWMSERLWAFPDGKYALYAHLGAQNVPDVDALAQLIREIDGKHQLGAGALAERIVEWFAAAPEAKP